MQILDKRWRQLADRERALLEHLIEFLQGFGAPPEDASLVRRKLEDLEELFLLVIVGEFNSGKSAFINALLGEDELSREGVTPTTDRITVLKHGEEAVERERREGILEKEHPNDFLREVAIVDTPGTNAIIRHHEELSRGFVPRSDLVLFVTSSDRPFTESEREYLELIRDWGKKIVLVVNKVDLLREDDFKMSENVESQLELYREDMKRDFEARMSEIENIILTMNERGDEWFEENIRLANVRELIQRNKVQDRFQREVVADTEKLIDERVEELIDWMVDRNLKQWRAIVEYVNRRRQARYDEHVIGEVGDNFEYNRSQLLQSVGKNATDVVQRYDREYESQQLALSLQGAVAQTAAVEVGALGLGAAFVAVATTAAADVTGIKAGRPIARPGLFILPNRRRRARAEFREKTDALRERLGEVVRRQFEAELNRSVERMREAIAPYTRFVRTEHARMTEARSDLAKITAETEALRAEI